MASVAQNFKTDASNYMKVVPDAIKNATADLLENSDFLSRSIGMSNSYEDIMFILQSLGREPISLLGFDYPFIFDHVRRNYKQGTTVINPNYNCPKFTFYKEKPTVRFADAYNDPMNLKDKWVADMTFAKTAENNVLISYAESDDGLTNNKEIGTQYDNEFANQGTSWGGIASFANSMGTCDLVGKTNENFNHGKYKTLIARFHTNSMDSKATDDPTQTAISEKYGMSHGRNLLKINENCAKDISQGYDNPYCRVWTYHHQYNQIARAIRPFCEAETANDLESLELAGDDNTVGFRTIQRGAFKGGSERLDEYGVLNYRNGMVNIAPTAKIADYFNHTQDKKKTIKKCMFSIENLAWRTDNIVMDEFDEYGLSAEQKGPLGGRIMWFPPYDLKFSESVNVKWNNNEFIGRGEGVYTYTNTERRGNLSFMLLIDHPSILDYWTGRDAEDGGDMKNQGHNLTKGNAGGVDNLMNQENTLLRFFAGCDILSAKPHKYQHRIPPKKEVKDVEKKEEPLKEVVKETEEATTQSPMTIYCVLYYPNNYSGKDDRGVGSVVNPIYYLVNGVGTQKAINTNGSNPQDYPTTISKQQMNGYGGYEMREEKKGISVATETLKANQVIGTYTKSNQELLTNNNGKPLYYYSTPSASDSEEEGGDYFDLKALAKIVGSEALGKPAKAADVTSDWYHKRYYYRVDKSYENQVFTHTISYIDTTSFGLNSTGYTTLLGTEAAKALNIPTNDKDSKLISFTDMFVALEGTQAESLLKNLYDVDNVNTIKAIIDDKNNKFKIDKIEYFGLASRQGRVQWNEDLAQNRAETFKQWMASKNFPEASNAKAESRPCDPKYNHVNIGGSNTLDSKLWRCACVKFTYSEQNFNEASNDEQRKVQVNESGEPIMDTDKSKEGTEHPLMKTARLSLTNLHESGKIDLTQINSIDISKINDRDFKTEFQTNGEDRIKVTAEKVQKELEEQARIETKTVTRYDNEGEFFKELERHEPFLHHLITDKIKYFDPAFHSISPEGFNARLTFLQQCTRQGSTVGASDMANANTAYNLAFGRPPVCVLRLGDFYYTKILINGLNITYDNPQWDMNPEGIGMMPMFANVTLDFTFLGGSDMSGPISRLQNAVSFNYYANTSVYDNRAEMVTYDSDGRGREAHFRGFSYPDMLHPNASGVGNITNHNVTVSEVNGSTDSAAVGQNYTNGEIVNYRR